VRQLLIDLSPSTPYTFCEQKLLRTDIRNLWLQELPVELHVTDVARMLGLSELTIIRWARQGKIPAREHRGIFLFSPGEIERWAQMHNIQKPLETTNGAPATATGPLLTHSIRIGGVFFDVAGTDVSSVLRSALTVAPLPPVLDPERILDQILQREQMVSTGVGNGVALPHSRRPLGSLLPEPLIRVCFLRAPVDFNALDNQEVFVLFVILSPSTKMHLHLLSRLSFCLRQTHFTAFLRSCSDRHSFFQTLSGIEDALPSQADAAE
jgi:nitrogen PTS system EIIA component